MSADQWHVLGAGAIGCLASEALAGGGCAVTLLLRDPSSTGSAQLQVQREDSAQSLLVQTEHATSGGFIDKLLVTTKAYDVLQAVQSVAHRLSDGAEIVLLVNGMGLLEPLSALLPTASIYPGTTTEGAYRTAPLHIRHAGRGTTRIGRQGQRRAPSWFEPWRESHLQCQWDADIDSALWAKLAVNCVINPLTALHRCHNGELADRPELAEQVDLLCREVMQVSYAAGYTDTAQTLAETVQAVIAGTAANRSSMLQDVEHGRRTEIDFITGHLLAVADQHAIVAPHHRELMQRIKNSD